MYDEVIGYITRFEDKNLTVVKQIPIVQNKEVVNKSIERKVEPEPKSEPEPEVGIDLEDIKAKEVKDVDTSFVYGNIDDSDEDLKSVVQKAMASKNK